MSERTKLREALQESTRALDDWIRTYAPEFCNETDVEATHARISAAGGTLAYIADIRQRNLKLLEWDEVYNG